MAGNVSTPAAPVTIQIVTTPPTTPTLALAAGSQTVAGEPNDTTDQIVNLTGTTSAGTYVALYREFDLNTTIMKTQADSGGNFSFANVALAPGSQALTVVASDVAGNTSQATQTFTTTAADTSAR